MNDVNKQNVPLWHDVDLVSNILPILLQYYKISLQHLTLQCCYTCNVIDFLLLSVWTFVPISGTCLADPLSGTETVGIYHVPPCFAPRGKSLAKYHWSRVASRVRSQDVHLQELVQRELRIRVQRVRSHNCHHFNWKILQTRVIIIESVICLGT